jgi:hypothetical protein
LTASVKGNDAIVSEILVVFVSVRGKESSRENGREEVVYAGNTQ